MMYRWRDSEQKSKMGAIQVFITEGFGLKMRAHRKPV